MAHKKDTWNSSEKRQTKRRQRDGTDRNSSLVFEQPNTRADNLTQHRKSCWCHSDVNNVTHHIAPFTKLLKHFADPMCTECETRSFELCTLQ